MSEPIDFYYNPQSRAVMVHWMLEEVGADYRIHHIGFDDGSNRAPAFLAINPMGKIPVIVERGTVVTETAAIIAHLADLFADKGLCPAPGSPERGAYYRWLFFAAGCIEPALIDKMFDRPDIAQPAALGYGSYEAMIGAVVQALSPGPFLLGERFSAADVYVASELSWGVMSGVAGIADRPEIAAYLQRCTERPAFKRSIGATLGDVELPTGNSQKEDA